MCWAGQWQALHPTMGYLCLLEGRSKYPGVTGEEAANLGSSLGVNAKSSLLRLSGYSPGDSLLYLAMKGFTRAESRSFGKRPGPAPFSRYVQSLHGPLGHQQHCLS